VADVDLVVTALTFHGAGLILPDGLRPRALGHKRELPVRVVLLASALERQDPFTITSGRGGRFLSSHANLVAGGHDGAGYSATTGRHTSQGLKPASKAASDERKRRRYWGFILLALRQVAWQKIPVVGVARYGEPANSSTVTPSPSSSPTFSPAPKAYCPVVPSFLTTR
jgi:hypothetical protein